MQEKDYLNIERYYQGDLQGKELAVFKEQMKTDPEFREEVELYKEVEHTMTSRIAGEDQKQDLLNTLGSLGDQHIKSDDANKGRSISMKRYLTWAAAASITILIGISLLYDGKPSYEKYAIHQQLDLVERGDDNTLLMKAEDAFNNKNYEEAVPALEKLSSVQTENVELKLYLGIAYIETGAHQAAERVLTEIKDGNSIFKHKATWYLALSQLKQENHEACKQLLNEIPADAEEYKQAQKILKGL